MHAQRRRDPLSNIGTALTIIDAREIADCADEAARWRLICDYTASLLHARRGGMAVRRTEISCKPRGRDYELEATFFAED